MPKKKVPAIERFLAKIIIAEVGCWEWTANLYWNGYGEFWDGNKYIRAHRFSYEWFKGEIPDGLQLDHLCRNRACVNPDHLEVVTSRDNILRGIGFAVKNASATHCSHGHPYDLFNTYYRPGGGRSCKTCGRRCKDG